jgi:dTDP-D-glucose 4,6-dehydratase
MARRDRLVVIDAMTYAANGRSLEPMIADRSITFVKGDIGDAALLQRLFEEHGFSRVAHLAAESHVDRSISDPEAFLQTNVLGTFTLLKTALDFWRSATMIETARFFTFRPTKSTARWDHPIRPLPRPHRIVPIRPMRQARPRAITSFAPLS